MKYLLLVLIVAAALAAKLPLDSSEAHKRADGILYPRLVADLNEFALGHGSIEDRGHFDKLDKQDAERLKKVRTSFRDWDDAMKQAGY